jgi:lactoylglutathione lyase
VAVTEGFPIVATADLPAMLRFYGEGLGGEVTYRFPPEGDADADYVALRIGGAHLGLGRDPELVGAPAQRRVSLWFYVDDCDAAVAALAAVGGVTVTPPTDEPWGERVARLRDPDGNHVLVATAA